ncbi:SRPBCC domain-containing protein [Kribbella sp. NPDC055071]
MSQSSIEPVRQEVVVPVDPRRAFELYVNRPGRAHPADGQSGDPLRIVYEPFAGGRWYEVDRSGREYEWGRVLTWDPPHRLTLAWMVGAATGEWAFDPDPAHASLAEITFEPIDGGTRVAVEHTGFERHGRGADSIRRGVSTGWAEDLHDLQRAIEPAKHP